MSPIYQRIEELCQKKGINITFLCTECGIKRTSLSDFKNGKKETLSVKTLAAIAEYFGVSLDYLYGGEAPIPDEESIKVALFGGGKEVTAEMWNEVKNYARYLLEQKNGNE